MRSWLLLVPGIRERRVASWQYQRVDEALVWFHKATKLPIQLGSEDHEGLVEAYMQIGHILQHHKNDKEGAREAFEQALRLKPDHPQVQTILRSL
jgi:tetratricopeptide (TPR) repeat protein